MSRDAELESGDGTSNPPVSTGTRIGPYRIEARLGAGGMGVVYRAHDSKLDRPVAIKFLATGGTDVTSRRRFQREALTTSSLNHPHILTVHDVGEHEGRQYLVTEYVDGGTLEDWIRADRRTWKQVVGLLIGIADALAAAHARGILHRDLKPANILLAGTGHAKLADFGLARPSEPSGDPERTTTTVQTMPGTILGTPAYMSPEQAAGGAMDARSDIFSFGGVLYESLAGRRPFDGSTHFEVLHAVQSHEPPAIPGIPALLQHVVTKALEKDPADRYQSMAEVVVDLRRAARVTLADAGAASPVALTRPRAWRWALPALGVGFLAAWLWFAPDGASVDPLAGARISRLTDFEGNETAAAISPNGQFVAFLSDRGGTLDAWLTQIDAGAPQNLTRGEAGELWTEVRGLGFSHDGTEIWLGGGPVTRLRMLPIVGGTLRNFLLPTTVALDWSPDGAQLVYHSREAGDPIFVAKANGTDARLLLTGVDTQGLHQHYPVWSADGRWIYFVRGLPASLEMDLWRVSVTGGTPERLTHHNADVRYPVSIDANTVLYLASDGGPRRPWAFDVARRQTRQVSFGLEQFESLDASADGRRVVATVTSPRSSLWQVPILDRIAENVDVTPYPLPAARALAPRFGSAGLFYLSSRDGRDGLWRYDGTEAVRLWPGQAGQLFEPAAISPLGHAVAIVLRGNGTVRLNVVEADGSTSRVVGQDVEVRGSASWSPDGRWLVTGGAVNGEQGLFKIPVDGSPAVRLVAGQALNPVWSPDGTLIVYAGRDVGASSPLQAVRPDGTPVDLPAIIVRREGERVRFLPNGSGFVYMLGQRPTKDFWLYDIASGSTRQLTRLSGADEMRTFDVTLDGAAIVFDRSIAYADVVLIELPASREP